MYHTWCLVIIKAESTVILTDQFRARIMLSLEKHLINLHGSRDLMIRYLFIVYTDKMVVSCYITHFLKYFQN